MSKDVGLNVEGGWDHGKGRRSPSVLPVLPRKPGISPRGRSAGVMGCEAVSNLVTMLLFSKPYPTVLPTIPLALKCRCRGVRRGL